MSLSAAAACVAAFLFGTSMNTLVGVNESQKSTQAIVQSQEETQEQIKKAIEEQPQQVVNNYNIDNSVTTIDNSVTNIDNSTTIIENNTINSNEDIKVNSKTNDEGITIPVGDERLDTNPNPYIVHIKHLQCPKCGAYEYLEHYNKQDTNLVHYIGSCSACNYEY